MSRGITSSREAKRPQAATCGEPVPPGEFLEPNIGTDKSLITQSHLLGCDSSFLCHTPCPARQGESPPGKAQSPLSAVEGAGADQLAWRHRRLRRQLCDSKPPGHLTCKLHLFALQGDDSTRHAHSTALTPIGGRAQPPAWVMAVNQGLGTAAALA